MKNIYINENACVKNHMCPVINLCPVKAISQASPTVAPVIDKEKCINCGKCIKFCPYKAFSYKS